MDAGLNNTSNLISESPWRNAYWFARMLLNGDKYGSVGTKKERQLLELVTKLEAILAQDTLTDDEKVKVCNRTLESSMTGFFKETAKGFVLAENLSFDLNREMNCVDDIAVFILCSKYIVAPINAAISAVPSNDLVFCRETAQSIIDELGEESVGKVIATWDSLGVKGCLDVERSLVVSEFTKLRERWKQVSSADSHTLSRYRIKEIWHLITYDNDLSDDKLTMLGQQRQVFYLDEYGDRYKSASQHIGMSDYVRPLSGFIADIRREQNG